MKKKIGTMLLVAVMLVSSFATTVFAKETTPNTGDSVFSIYLYIPGGNIRQTEWRNKTNSTSTYIFLTDAPSDYAKCNVLGGTGKFEDNKNVTNISVETYGNIKPVKVPLGKWRIRQTVAEHGKNKACIQFNWYSQDGVVTGYWSPDCAGNYTSVN